MIRSILYKVLSGLLLSLALAGLTGCGGGLMSGTILNRMYNSVDAQDRMVTDATVHLLGDAETDPLRLDAGLSIRRDRAEGKTEGAVKLTGFWDGGALEHEERSILSESGAMRIQYHFDEEGWTRTQKRIESASEITMQTSFLENLREYKDIMVVAPDTVETKNGEAYEITVSMNPADGMAILGDLDALLEDTTGIEDYFRADRLGGMAVFVTLGVNTESMLPEYMIVEGRSNTGWEAVEEKDEDQKDGLMGLLSLVDRLTVRQQRFSKLKVRMDFDFPGESCVLIPEEARLASETPAPPEEPGKALDDDLPALPANAQVLLTFRSKEQELCSGGRLHVYMRRVWKTDEGSLNLDLNLVNNSEQSVVLFSESVAVNHTMLQDPYLYRNLDPGSSVIQTLKIDGLLELGIQKPGAVTLRLSADRMPDGESILSGVMCTFVLDHQLRNYKLPDSEAAELLWEDENLRVTAYAPVSDQNRMMIPLCIENLTDQCISLESDKMTDEKGNFLTTLLNGDLLSTMTFGDMLPHTCLLTAIPLTWDHIDTMLTRFPEELHFRMIAHDFRKRLTLFQTEELVLDVSEETTDETEASETEPGETEEASENSGEENGDPSDPWEEGQIPGGEQSDEAEDGEEVGDGPSYRRYLTSAR